MPCKKHAEELEGHSAEECEACELEDKAEEAYWRELYEGEKQAGLLNDPDYREQMGLPPIPDDSPSLPEPWWHYR